MKKLLLLGMAFCATITFAQERKLPVDTTITTQHSVTINGARIDYSATRGYVFTVRNAYGAVF